MAVAAVSPGGAAAIPLQGEGQRGDDRGHLSRPCPLRNRPVGGEHDRRRVAPLGQLGGHRQQRRLRAAEQMRVRVEEHDAERRGHSLTDRWTASVSSAQAAHEYCRAWITALVAGGVRDRGAERLREGGHVAHRHQRGVPTAHLSERRDVGGHHRSPEAERLDHGKAEPLIDARGREHRGRCVPPCELSEGHGPGPVVPLAEAELSGKARRRSSSGPGGPTIATVRSGSSSRAIARRRASKPFRGTGAPMAST